MGVLVRTPLVVGRLGPCCVMPGGRVLRMCCGVGCNARSAHLVCLHSAALPSAWSALLHDDLENAHAHVITAAEQVMPVWGPCQSLHSRSVPPQLSDLLRRAHIKHAHDAIQARRSQQRPCRLHGKGNNTLLVRARTPLAARGRVPHDDAAVHAAAGQQLKPWHKRDTFHAVRVLAQLRNRLARGETGEHHGSVDRTGGTGGAVGREGQARDAAACVALVPWGYDGDAGASFRVPDADGAVPFTTCCHHGLAIWCEAACTMAASSVLIPPLCLSLCLSGPHSPLKRIHSRKRESTKEREKEVERERERERESASAQAGHETVVEGRTTAVRLSCREAQARPCNQTA